MYCKERSLLYNAHLLYKLSELQKCLKEYIILLSSAADSTNDFRYNYDIQTQSEIIDPLKQIIEEINISKVFPDFLLQLKIQRRHEWTGRGIKHFLSSGALK
jgi:hypothetical protein